MSYDIVLWCPARPLSKAARVQAYRDLANAPLSTTAGVARAHAALVRAFPTLDDDPDGSPWAAAIERGPRWLVLPMSRSFVEETLPRVLAIAAKAGLHVFDPQTGAEHAPGAPPATGTAKPNKPTRPQAETRLAAALAPVAKKHGFSPVAAPPRGFVAFAREPAEGVRQWLMIQTGHSPTSARLWIRVAVTAIEQALAGAWPFEEGPYAINCELLAWYRDPDGRVKKRPEMLRHLAYEISPDECLAKATRAFTRDIAKYAVPALDALGTIAALDAAYNGDPASIRGRYLNGFEESAFVAVALAHLAGRKDRARVVAAGRECLKGRPQVADAYEVLTGRP
ncbi:MAG: hypothetical protein HYZ29_34050 [Myxococcales bacterium]|nr:hypothetical protein [Myxococcales bacterium]